MMSKFHVAIYNEHEKKFVIVSQYDDIKDVIKDYGKEVVIRGTKKVMLLEQRDVNIDINVTVLRNE